MKTFKDILSGLIKVGVGLYLAWLFIFFGFDDGTERVFVGFMLMLIVLLVSKLPRDHKDPNDRFWL